MKIYILHGLMFLYLCCHADIVVEEDVPFIVFLLSSCAHKWDKIGPKCGVPSVEIIKSEGMDDVDCLQLVLNKWWKKSRSTPPTYSKLIKALHSVQENALAEVLENISSLTSVITGDQSKGNHVYGTTAVSIQLIITLMVVPGLHFFMTMHMQ